MGNVENAHELGQGFGCNMGALLSSYFGLLIGASFRFVAVWDGVEERLCRRFALWKWQYVSKGGRPTLICGTLSSMAIYFMSLFFPNLVASNPFHYSIV